MPMAFDQIPNAARLESLGVARSLTPRAYRATAVARLLGDLLNSAEAAKQCKALAARFRGSRALEEACLAVEELAPVSARGGVARADR
jgi:UDP:flavonoid glycosyltransferase YjiC (YdhE family)